MIKCFCGCDAYYASPAEAVQHLFATLPRSDMGDAVLCWCDQNYWWLDEFANSRVNRTWELFWRHCCGRGKALSYRGVVRHWLQHGLGVET